MIRVEAFDVGPVRESRRPAFGSQLYAERPEPTVYEATLSLRMDIEGVEVFLAAMDKVCPGFRNQCVVMPALPAGPLVAEFEDDQ